MKYFAYEDDLTYTGNAEIPNEDKDEAYDFDMDNDEEEEEVADLF